MRILWNKIYYYLIVSLIIGSMIDIFETIYGLKFAGLEEINLITLFFINIIENTVVGVIFSGVIKITMILILYALTIIIKNTIQETGGFSNKFFRLTWNFCIFVILIIANYTTYLAVWNNYLLIQ